MPRLFFQSFCTKKWPDFFFQSFCTKKWPNFFFNLFNTQKWRKHFRKNFGHFLRLKNFTLTYQLLFFWHKKWKVISRDHELWGVKFDLKTGFQTLLSFFLVGLFSRPRYQKYSPWTGEFILGHRGTHKCVTAI